MRIRVRFFAILRDRVGESEMSLELPAGASVADASGAVGSRVPAVSALLKNVAFAVNQAYASPSTVLNDGDELALIPPVSGG